jgi:hypothetical protein
LEAHEALDHFEKVTRADEEFGGPGEDLARTAAVVVAVLAARLAIATFLSNEAVKEVISGETKGADTNAQLEAKNVKTIVGGADALCFASWGPATPRFWPVSRSWFAVGGCWRAAGCSVPQAWWC